MSKLLISTLVTLAFVAVASPALACTGTSQQAAATLTDNALVNTAAVNNQLNQANTVMYEQANPQQNVVPQGPNVTVADTTQGTLTLIQNPSVNTGTVINNVNQENKVFLGPEPTPTPTPSPTPTPAPTPRIKTNDFVALLITDGLSHVRPGEKFTYLVKMRNNLPNDVRVSTLRVRIPAFVIPRTESIRGHESLGAEVVVTPASRTIEWKNFNISADAEITFALNAEVEAFAPNAYELIANAHLNGDGISQIAEDKTIVQRLEAIAAAQVVTAPQETVQVAPAASRPAVPVTAKTGPSVLMLGTSPLLTLAGLLGLRRVLQK